MGRQNSQTVEADDEQNDEIAEADYARVTENSMYNPGRVGEVVEVYEENGTPIYVLRFEDSAETHYTADYLDPLGSWTDGTSVRVREFVSAVLAEGEGEVEVGSAGDVGVNISPAFEGGTLSRTLFEIADSYGLETTEVRFRSETVLFRDRARTE